MQCRSLICIKRSDITARLAQQIDRLLIATYGRRVQGCCPTWNLLCRRCTTAQQGFKTSIGSRCAGYVERCHTSVVAFHRSEVNLCTSVQKLIDKRQSLIATGYRQVQGRIAVLVLNVQVGSLLQ